MGCALALAACTSPWTSEGGDYGGGGSTGGGGGGGGGTTTPTEGDCPGGDTCSAKTPGGLAFTGAQPVSAAFPNGWDSSVYNHILSGGADVIALADANADTAAPFALPFTASTDDPILVIEGANGAVIDLRETTGIAHLRIVDPSTGELFDRYAYASSPLARALAIPTTIGEQEQLNAAIYAQGAAFWHGTTTVGVAMLSTANNRLIDTEMTVALDGATQTAWDTLKLPASLGAGHHAISAATSSGLTQTVDLAIVDHVDSVAVLYADADVACFAATTDGAFVVNVPWTFEIAGQVVQQDAFSHWMGESCLINPNNAHPFAVTAHAGGMSATSM